MSKLDIIKTLFMTQSHEQKYKNSIRNPQLFFSEKRHSSTIDAFTRFEENNC